MPTLGIEGSLYMFYTSIASTDNALARASALSFAQAYVRLGSACSMPDKNGRQAVPIN